MRVLLSLLAWLLSLNECPLGHCPLMAGVLDLPLKSIDKLRWRQYYLSPVLGFQWLYHVP